MLSTVAIFETTCRFKFTPLPQRCAKRTHPTSAASVPKYTDDLQDQPFDNGMLVDAQKLGDTGKSGADGTFDPAWTEAFKKAIDGIILVSIASYLSPVSDFRLTWKF